MRYIIAIITTLFITLSATAQGDSTIVNNTPTVAVEVDNNTLWQRGNQAYIDGDYTAAIANYTAIENRGQYSAKLYYNLANAYFKNEEIGYAILYYHRALRVSPTMEDARYNLTIAESLTKDKIAVVPQFFLNRWMLTLQRSISGTAWSAISIILLAAALSMLLLFLLGSRIKVRKIGFYGTIAISLLFVITSIFAIAERNDMINREQAIVMSSAISVKSSPDKAATDLFVLHEGTKVKITTQVDGWYEIVIADGKKGWAEESHIEKI